MGVTCHVSFERTQTEHAVSGNVQCSTFATRESSRKNGLSPYMTSFPLKARRLRYNETKLVTAPYTIFW